MELGSVFKEARRKRKLTQGALSQLANISQSELSMLENGNFYPKPKQIGEIIKALNNDAIGFLDESEWFKFLYSYIRYYLDELLSSQVVSVDYSETSTNEASIKVKLIENMIFEYKTKIDKSKEGASVRLATDLSMLEFIVDGADETNELAKKISILSMEKREKFKTILKLIED